MARMRRTLLILAVVVAAAGLAALKFFGPQAQPYAEPRPPSADRPAHSIPATGVASCSGRSCHGSLEITTNPISWQTEYTLWLGHDPHARAYHVLLEPLSRDIARQLGLKAAHTATECLACHVTPRLAMDHGDAELLERERRFGVSCEACHGKADRWIEAHLTDAWRKKSSDEKQHLGMTALADPAVLSKACAGCHVGAPPGAGQPARDVNHDLIAAGHPRLAFEMSAFFANLPKHWREPSANRRRESPGEDTAWEARLWAVGQTVSAESALALLQHRAVSKDAPWPEFAEYDCASCHHQLITPSARQSSSGGRPGTPPWGTWSFAMAPVLAELTGADVKLAGLDKLQRSLSALPPRETAARQAPEALAEMAPLRRRLAEMPLDQPTVTKWLERLTQHSLLLERPSWDRAEQTFLALHALNQAVKDESVRQRLARLAQTRAFPAGYNSPRGFDPIHFLKRLRE